MNGFLKGLKGTLMSAEGLGALVAVIVAIAILNYLDFGPHRIEAEIRAATAPKTGS